MSSWINALLDDGFTVIPGPIPAGRWRGFCAAYDAAVAAGQPPELAIGRASTRVEGLVDCGPEFDDVYIHPPLLEACQHLIGRSFKLSSLKARTVTPGAHAQDL